VPAREKVTGKTAWQDEFITLGRNLARAIFVLSPIGCCAPGALLLLRKKNDTVASLQAFWPLGRPHFAPPFEIREESLQKIRGLGCTIPHKESYGRRYANYVQ
jgi:hypothetical protein